MGDYGLLFTEVWTPEQKMKDELFEKDGSLTPMVLNFIDIPNLHKNTAQGRQFIYALNDCEDLKIFSLRSVQIIIDCHYRHWRWLNLKAFGIPLIILLIFFWHWSNIILTHLKKD